jgi:hypothetical protein
MRFNATEYVYSFGQKFSFSFTIKITPSYDVPKRRHDVSRFRYHALPHQFTTKIFITEHMTHSIKSLEKMRQKQFLFKEFNILPTITYY